MGEKFVPVDAQLNAVLEIGTHAFPFAQFYDDLEHYTNGFVNWHKQRQIEISVLLEGSAEVQVFEQKQQIPVGDAFLVFPGNLHTVRMGGENKTRYFTLIFDPILLYGYQGSFFYEAYYLPYANSGVPFYRIEQSWSWSPAVLDDLRWIDRHPPTEEPASRLAVFERLRRVWLTLCTELFAATVPAAPFSTQEEQQRITVLLRHLHAHVADKFSLSALAAAGNISRSECCRFFKKMLHLSPTAYLLDYRLAQSVELLDAGRLSVTEIAHAVGFSSASYFIAAFRKKLGCTPLHYQKSNPLQPKEQEHPTAK